MIIIAIALIIVGGISLLGLLFLRLSHHKRTVNEVIKDKVILKIAVPRHNEKSPIAAEQLFSSLHGIGASKKKSIDQFSLEIAAGNYGIHFIVAVDKKYKGFMENQFYAQYPEAQISQIGDYTQSFTNEFSYDYIELGLVKSSFLPIKTFLSFEVDPLAAITSAISSLENDNESFIQIVCRPLSDDWHTAGRDYVNQQKNKVDADGKKSGMEMGESEKLSQIERKSNKVGFQFTIRILSKSRDSLTAQRMNREIEAAFGQYKTGQFNSIGNPPKLKGFAAFKKDMSKKFNQFILGRTLKEKLSGLEKYKNRFLDEMESDIINIEELASLYHLPNKSVETPNISWAESKRLEYPLNIPTEGCRIIGVTDYRGVHIPFGIRPIDRLRHMYLIGKTGMGKSTFMESLIIADIYDNQGVAVIDPHGDTIKHILDAIPPHRLDDVVIFDPGDNENPVGMNLLELKPGENVSLVADGLVSVFHKAFVDSWGPRLEYILTNTIITLLSCQNVSLLAIPRILTDKNYRKFLLKQVQDPVILKFWEEEYAQMSKTAKDTQDNVGSILNKIGRFTTNPLIRNIIGQVKSTMDFEDIMNNRKILLINLSQGKVGEENMALLGGMLITRIYSNTVRRIDIDPEKRVPFYLYVDEFQNFATTTFVKILSEARKFGLGLTVTHQFIDQIEEDIQNAIFGNIGTIMNFAVGPRDAEVLVKEYSPYMTAEDLVNQAKYGLVIKLSIDFAQSKPFTAKTLAPTYPKTGLAASAIDMSRQKYSKPRDVMEQKIYKWAAQVYSDKGNLIQPEVTNAKPFESGPNPIANKPSENNPVETKSNDSPPPATPTVNLVSAAANPEPKQTPPAPPQQSTSAPTGGNAPSGNKNNNNKFKNKNNKPRGPKPNNDAGPRLNLVGNNQPTNETPPAPVAPPQAPQPQEMPHPDNYDPLPPA